eukprot:TRINITY_DN4798_c0_g1_i1.p2 TRINITY_DN4798_c0_g1~~TRINITY_DN4798_c0_g1_i1.p2  ORF type:complete len:100 (+),score=21.45 TRINITY_DN4798_c0_g1_i1:46-345(+)
MPLLLLFVLLGASVTWIFVLLPFWFLSWVVEVYGGWPWWGGLLLDLVYIAAVLMSLKWMNERQVAKAMEEAEMSDQDPLADHRVARQLEEMERMQTPLF